MKIKYWILSGLAIAAVVVLVVLVLPHSSATAGKQATQAPRLIPFNPQLGKLREALQNDQISEEDRRGLEEKLAMEERMATEQAAGAQASRQEKVPPPLPVAAKAMPEPVQEGIFAGSQGLIRPSVAKILNLWQGERSGVLTQVFAGSLPDHPQQGIVLVVQINPENMKRTMELRQAPGETGPLRIIEAQEPLLILSANDGTRLVFNLDTLSFQD